MEALNTATSNTAICLGLYLNIGPIKVGKLTDMFILYTNPLNDIYKTESIRYAIINVRLYDAETMNEEGLYKKPRSKFFWELNKFSEAFPYHEGGIGQHHIDD